MLHPKLLASVVVHDELKISALASQAALPLHIYSHLLTNESVAGVVFSFFDSVVTVTS